MEHVRRDQNKKADALSKLASMTFSKLAKEVLVEVGQYKQRALSKRYTKALVECMQGHDPLIHTKKAKAGDDTYNLSMAFLLVRDRHCRATANSTRSASKAEFQGKMGLTWEGPYIVKKAYGDRATARKYTIFLSIERKTIETGLHSKPYVGIKRLLDDLGVTAAKVCVTAAK
ncbi:hypothetical protein Tco_0871019 [Tanacetum coccineum]